MYESAVPSLFYYSYDGQRHQRVVRLLLMLLKTPLLIDVSECLRALNTMRRRDHCCFFEALLMQSA